VVAEGLFQAEMVPVAVVTVLGIPFYYYLIFERLPHGITFGQGGMFWYLVMKIPRRHVSPAVASAKVGRA
jgi:hypothetical protein